MGLVTFLRTRPPVLGAMLLVWLGIFATNARGADEYFGRTATAIDVQGLKRIEKDAILQKIQTKPGSPVSAETLRQDIQSIFSLGYFDDIELDAVRSGDGVKLTFNVKERPAIAKIEFDGNERIDTSDLKEVIKVKEWSILDVNKVKEDVALLQKHYEEKGFYLAKVGFDVKTTKADEVELVYKINDYDKVQIKKITFLNNRRFSDDQLKSVMAETREGNALSFLTSSGSFKDTAFKQDLQRLTLWYLDHGYVKFAYEAPVITVSDDKRWLFISIYVNEGEQYRIGEVDFGGDLLYSKEELAQGLQLTKGEIFSYTKRNLDIQRLTEKYQDLGYAFVNVVPDFGWHDEERVVDLTYKFEKGNLVYFGEINMVGNSKTHDKVIRRELTIHEGELFSGTQLRVSRENVERLGYFQPGEVIFNQTTPKGQSDVVNVEISVKERSTGTITLGAGFGSAQGLFLSSQISEINLFGSGRSITFSGQYAANTPNNSFNLGVTDPYFLDTRFSAGADAFWTLMQIINKYSVRRLGFNLRAGYPLVEYVQAFITYKFENLEIENPVAGLPPEVSDGDRGILSSIILSLVRDKRNNRFETTDGNYQSVSFETAGLGGVKSFLKGIANARFYKRIIGDLVFRNNNQIGQIWGLGGRVIPPSERFYLGGPNDMKGFFQFQLGPSVPGPNGIRVPTGGTFQYYSLFEIEHPLIKEAGIKFVAFFDVGNTVDDFLSFRPRADWGVGIRWFSPIGPLRFEWGFPINPVNGEAASQFQFFIGPPF